MLTNELGGRNGVANGQATSLKTPGKAGSSRKPVAKAAKVARTQAHKDRVAVGVAVAASVSTVALSMVLNTWAFTAVHGGWFGTALGVLLPLWVLALTYQAFHMRRRQPWVSAGCYVLAGFALVVSLPHLANGYASLGLHEYEGWSLALVTDLLQVLMKLSLVKMVSNR
jgi:predicted membrane channel-forming protein YqfA (hemolysin III family)